LSSLVERVTSFLANAGYQQLRKPLEVASIKFDFSGVLVGGDRALDLVIVENTARDSQARLVQRVESLSRALDVAESRRSLTVVLVGTRLAPVILERMSRVARTLVIEGASESEVEQEFRDRLAALLPLPSLPRLSGLADSLEDLWRHLGPSSQESTAQELVAAASKGSNQVESRLRTLLEQPLKRLNRDE
jgi:hypothetical protein